MAREVKFTYATRVDGGGQPYPASRDTTLPFSLWIPSSQAMGYKAKGKWEALGHGACRRRYGRPERERSYKTSLFLLWLMLHPIPPTGVPASGIGYGFYQV
jgi:hypothetical protein